MSERDERVEALAEVVRCAHGTATDQFCRDCHSEGYKRVLLRSPAVRDLLAEAWDEGHRFTGYDPERGENPYRQEAR